MAQSRMRGVALAVAAACGVGASLLEAQTTAPATARTTPGAPPSPAAPPTTTKPAADPIEDFIDKTKNPIPGILNWGMDMRMRDEWFINAARLSRQAANNEEHYQRYRGRWWATLTPVQDVELYMRFTWEGRDYCSPLHPANAADPDHPLDRGWMNERDDILIDNLYLKLSNIGGLPVTVQAGRMDLNMTDNWLFGEGGVMDGSRTYYFDAVRVLTELKDLKTSIDLYYIYADAQGDDWFPKLREQSVPPLMAEADSQGAALFVTNKSLPNTLVEPYFIYTNRQHEWFLDKRSGDDADIYTFGLRVAGDVGKHWKYTANVASQFGHKNDRSLCSLGSLDRITYLLNDSRANEFYLEYEYLSGDKPGSDGTDEGFDILWGRQQRWDELYGVTFGAENGIWNFTNMHRVSPGWKSKPTPQMEVGLRYDLLFADTNPFENTGMFADGCFRGSMIVPYFKYTFNKHMFTRVMPAFFFPGDYYARSNNDAATFFRFEVVLTW